MPTDDERIRRRAYEIWEREGRPEGREAEHWRKAAEELASESSPADTQEVPAARVRGPAKLDESTSDTGAIPAAPAPAAPGPEPQNDPLGLAHPTAKAPRKRAPRKARPRNEPPSPTGNGTSAPDRSR